MKYKTILLLLVTAVIIAAGSGTPRLSPWDAWRMAYTSFEQGEEQRDKGEYTKARQSFDKALQYYNMVREARPDWNQKVISERIADCEKESRRMSAFLGPAAASGKSTAAAQAQKTQVRSAAEDNMRRELSETKAELEELRRRNETRKNYESEISNLLRDQRILNERYSLLEKRYRAQEAKLAEPDQKRQKLEEQLVALRLQLDLARKEAAAAKQQSAASAAERSALKKARESAENSKRKLDGEISSLRRLITRKDGELALLKRTVEDAEKRESELRSEFDRSRTNAAALNAELNTLQNKYREKLAASGAGEAANKKLVEENKRLQDALVSLRKSGEAEAVKTAARQRQIETLRVQIADEVKKSASASVALRNEKAKNSALAQELSREKANAAIINRELASLRQNANSNSADLRKLNAENNELKKRLKFRDSEDFKNLTAARSERKKMRDEILKAEQTIASLKTELKISNEKYNALERSGRELQSENRKLHTERISLEDRLKTLSGVSANSKELLNQYTELKKNFAALQAENRQNKLAADAAKPREAELERIKLRLAELDGLKQQLRREQSFNEQLNAVKNRLDREVKQLRPMESENNKLKAQLSDFQMLKSEVERLRKLNRELAEAKKLEGRVADLQRQLARLTPEAAEAEKLRRQNQELLQGKVLWDNEISKMKLRLASMSQLEKQVENLQKDLQQKNVLLQKSNDKVLRLTAENKTLGSGINDLENLRTKSRRLVADQAKTLQDLKRSMEEVRSQKQKNARLQQETLEMQRRAGNAAKLLKEREDRIGVLDRELAALRKRFLASGGEKDKALQAYAQTLKLKKEAESRSQQLAASLQASQKANSALQKEIAALQKVKNEKQLLEAKMVKFNDILKNKELSDRNAAQALQSLKESQKLIAALRSEISVLKEKSSDTRQLDEALGKIDAALKLKQASDRNAAHAVQKLKENEKLIASLRSEITRLQKIGGEKQQLEKALADTRALLEAKKSSEKKALQATAAAQKDLQKNAEIAANLRKELAQLKKAASEGRLQAAALQAETDSRARKKAEETAAENMRKLAAAEKRLSEIYKENEMLKGINSKNVNLEQELAASRLISTRMRSELEQLRPLRAELARLGSDLKKRTDELSIAKKQNERLISSAAESRRVAEENRNIIKLNTDLANRSLKAESELAALKSELANYNRLRSEAAQLRKLNAELSKAKSIEAELAQAKLHIARLEQIRDELVRQRKLNEELSRKRVELEKELAARPMPAFAPANYTPAASIKPVGKAEDYISAGRIAAADDKNELAIWNYRTALRLAPDNPVAAELLGKLLALRGDYGEAAPLLSRARNANPSSIPLALETAYAYIALKRFGNAEAVIEPLLKRNQDDPHLQIAAAQIAAGNGQYARASGLLLLAAARLPNDPQPKLELARLLCNTDSRRIFEAVKLYEEARRLGAPPDLELEPRLAPMLNKRRNMTNFLSSAAAEASKNKDWHSVIWYYRQLIDLDREPEKYRPRLAFAQYKKGSSSAALEVLSMGKETSLGLLVKAFIHTQRKEMREARQCLAQAKLMNKNKPIEIPADWREFILELRQHGKGFSSYIR